MRGFTQSVLVCGGWVQCFPGLWEFVTTLRSLTDPLGGRWYVGET